MEDLLNKESVQRVVKVLSNFDDSLRVEVLNSSARTAKDAAISLKCEIGAIVISLLLKTDDNFILCLVAGDKRCSLNKVKRILNMKDVSMADAGQVKGQTGFSIGGVSPIAHLNKKKQNQEYKISLFDKLNKFKQYDSLEIKNNRKVHNS